MAPNIQADLSAHEFEFSMHVDPHVQQQTQTTIRGLNRGLEKKGTELLDPPDHDAVAKKCNVAYPSGIEYEYKEPVLNCRQQAPPFEQLHGVYDVLLYAEEEENKEQNQGRSFRRFHTVVGRMTVKQDNDGRLEFVIYFGDDCDQRTQADKRNWYFITEKERGDSPMVGITSCPYSPFYTSGYMFVVEKGATVNLRLWDASIRPSGEREEQLPLQEAEKLLALFSSCYPHWLHTHTVLPLEVVRLVKQFLSPPPVFCIKEGDLWMKGFCLKDDGGYSHRWSYLARRVGSCAEWLTMANE